jgi:hypothetical protein
MRLEFVLARIELLSHRDPLVSQKKPVVLFIRRAASLGFSAAFFCPLAVFCRFRCIRHVSASSRHHPGLCKYYCLEWFCVKYYLRNAGGLRQFSKEKN